MEAHGHVAGLQHDDGVPRARFRQQRREVQVRQLHGSHGIGQLSAGSVRITNELGANTSSGLRANKQGRQHFAGPRSGDARHRVCQEQRLMQ